MVCHKRKCDEHQPLLSGHLFLSQFAETGCCSDNISVHLCAHMHIRQSFACLLGVELGGGLLWHSLAQVKTSPTLSLSRRRGAGGVTDLQNCKKKPQTE